MLTLSATVTLPAAAIALLTSVPDRGFTTSPIGELFLESADDIFIHEATKATGLTSSPNSFPFTISKNRNLVLIFCRVGLLQPCASIAVAADKRHPRIQQTKFHRQAA